MNDSLYNAIVDRLSTHVLRVNHHYKSNEISLEQYSFAKTILIDIKAYFEGLNEGYEMTKKEEPNEPN